MNRLVVCSFLCVLSSAAMADDNWVKGDATFGGNVEAGATFTTGNTQTSSFKAKADLKHELEDWENEYIIEGLYTKDDEAVTAKRYQLGAQGNYKFDESNYLFANGNYEVDEFRGFDYQIATAAGYGHKFFDDGGDMLRAEIGPGYIYQRLTPDQRGESNENSNATLVAHTVIEYTKRISDSSTFNSKLVSDFGNQIISRLDTSITAKVVDSLAMKFGVTVRYNSEPLDNIKSTDTETTLTLLYSF
ncbi:DUF481 domain-containing protein [Shewanella sp. 202IG2-18]|uniref:DUF481 domain-containing protein n=1 Tax=Parashewanella hymeniacidonis TaxID=2807618 RepID=UPI0019616480|nr:DUF481 domain-containing protein [Parashewanella hymeniacidonis]MBM7073440.1 DUF481 domain-containing protein [Parashewanella hymeniacidonis]